METTQTHNTSTPAYPSAKLPSKLSFEDDHLKEKTKLTTQTKKFVSQPTRFCVYCQKDKVWKFRGDKAKDGSKIYIDEKKSRWAGKRCPDCERSRVRAANKHDYFERSNVVATLKQSGYEVLSTVSPIMVQKEGQVYRVLIQRAYKDPKSGGVYIEKTEKHRLAQTINPDPSQQPHDLTALLFQTTKILTPEQMETLTAQCMEFQSLSAK